MARQLLCGDYPRGIGAHNGEAAASKKAFNALSDYDRDSIIEYLKTLKVLPPGSRSLLIVDRDRDDFR